MKPDRSAQPPAAPKQQTHIPAELSSSAATRESGRYILIASPLTPMGGGMLRISEYLMQHQTRADQGAGAILRPLETRGGGSALWSPAFLLVALGRLIGGRLSGRLAGVHVNVAERLSLVRKGLIVVACRLLGIPVVLHLHAGQLPQNYAGLPGAGQALVRWMFSLPACCVVLGPGAAEFVSGTLKVPPERVHVVFNGVPQATVPRRDPQTVLRQQVLFVANLSDRKGVSDLLQALATPHFHNAQIDVTLAGGGDVAGFRAMATRLGLDHWVRFEGWVDQQRVAHLLARSDVMVLPSYDEGLPLCILEALAHGLAVVCTPVGQIPHVLTDGVDASFVQPGDVEGIARALSRVLGDPAFRQQLERNGRALYERQFSMAHFCAGIARVHQRHFGLCGFEFPPEDPASPGGEGLIYR